MPVCLTRFAGARIAALVVVSVLLCPAGRLAADVVTVGAVTPIPPVGGGTSTAQLIVGAGTDETSNDIWGWVSVDDGTLLQYGTLIVGDNEGFFGEINVSGNFLAGVNTKLNVSALGGGSGNPSVQIGNEGTGYLNVGGGTQMTLMNQGADMSIGLKSTGVGYATITDPFTILTVADFLHVGQSGIGTLNVLNGALVRTLNTSSTRFISIGSEATGVGTVVVDGQGSVLRSGSSLIVGGTVTGPPATYGQGTLRISNGAIGDADNTTLARVTVGLLGRIELDGGTLIANTPVLPAYGTTVDGYLGGSGLVRGSAFFGGDSSVEANSGDVLRFNGDVESQGAVTIENAEVRFLAGFTNNAAVGAIPPGRITLEDGTVRFTEALVNDGVLSSANGATNIHGEITNQGEIVVARDTVATFNDTVNNTTGTITVKPGGNALFLADLSFLGLSTLKLGVGTEDLTDTSAQIDTSGVMTLGGTLEISFDGGYLPAVGQSFELLTAGGGIVGAFDTVLLPLMPNNLEVGVLYSPSSVMMEIRIDPTSIDLPGDYNGDGEVNSADYTVWRNSLGQTGSSLAADGSGPTPGIPDGVVNQFDYSFWKAHFGDTAVVGAGSTQATSPEPPTLVLLCLAIVPLLGRARRQSS